jgi:hypothetical protein
MSQPASCRLLSRCAAARRSAAASASITGPREQVQESARLGLRREF